LKLTPTSAKGIPAASLSRGFPAQTMLLVRSANADLIVIDFFLESVAVDAKHLGRLHLIAVMRKKREFDERLLNLLEHNIVQSVQLYLGFLLLLEKNFEFALYEFL
jgi:hypothetical protein